MRWDWGVGAVIVPYKGSTMLTKRERTTRVIIALSAFAIGLSATRSLGQERPRSSSRLLLIGAKFLHVVKSQVQSEAVGIALEWTLHKLRIRCDLCNMLSVFFDVRTGTFVWCKHCGEQAGRARVFRGRTDAPTWTVTVELLHSLFSCSSRRCPVIWVELDVILNGKQIGTVRFGSNNDDKNEPESTETNVARFFVIQDRQYIDITNQVKKPWPFFSGAINILKTSDIRTSSDFFSGQRIDAIRYAQNYREAKAIVDGEENPVFVSPEIRISLYKDDTLHRQDTLDVRVEDFQRTERGSSFNILWHGAIVGFEVRR